jgi:hypothetical protein
MFNLKIMYHELVAKFFGHSQNESSHENGISGFSEEMKEVPESLFVNNVPPVSQKEMD